MKSLGQLASTLKGLVKIAVESRRTDIPKLSDADELLIMGNGPSLRQTIDRYGSKMKRMSLLAVNYAANTPEYQELRPRYYVIADPHFFQNAATDPNVERLLENLFATSWPLTLFIPALAKLPEGIDRGNVEIRRFNAVGIEGYGWFRRMAYGRRSGMPRPRNVLIPSIMIGIWLGYRTIYIAGADHSWTRTLEVNERNEVVSVQPHFYKEDKREEARVTAVYRNVRMHEILESFMVAFRSYFDIADYAAHTGTRIINITPGSFIDAFERGELEGD